MEISGGLYSYHFTFYNTNVESWFFFEDHTELQNSELNNQCHSHLRSAYGYHVGIIDRMELESTKVE
jgi:hypothetical protein